MELDLVSHLDSSRPGHMPSGNQGLEEGERTIGRVQMGQGSFTSPRQSFSIPLFHWMTSTLCDPEMLAVIFSTAANIGRLCVGRIR